MVDSSPKSGRGRAVALDDGTVAKLREHRRRQLEERLAWGPAYADGDYVFSREDGSPYAPEVDAGRQDPGRAPGASLTLLHHNGGF